MKAIHQTAFLILMVVSVAASGAAAGQIKPPADAPKSWIPERRDVGDGRAAEVEPPLSEAEKREMAAERAEANSPLDIVNRTMTECIADAAAAAVTAKPTDNAVPGKASREFGEPFTQARALITKKQYADALPLLDKAEPHAADASQRLAIEQLRTAVYAGLDQKRDLLLSLEKQLASGALPLATVETYCQTIEGLKAIEGLPPYDLGDGKDANQ